MKVIKYDSNIVHIDYDKKYEQHRSHKPSGFWITLDHQYDWKNFCEAEDFRLQTLKVKNIFNLVPDHKVLIINTLEEFDNFSNEYISDDSTYYIDWEEISQKYDGIIITDYFWERRLHQSSEWYYGWDCVSGCIWNLNVIEKMNMLTKICK